MRHARLVVGAIENPFQQTKERECELIMLSKDQIIELEQFDTPTVCNAIESFGIRPDIEGYTRPGAIHRTGHKKSIVGYAATALVGGMYPIPNAHENLMGYYSHVREMLDPTIAVIQDTDSQTTAAFWGEVQATVHMSLGCIGTLIDGGVRDLAEVDAIGFQMYSTSLCVAHGYTHVSAYGCKVNILGLEINPGDLLHIDQHGAVKIPHDIASLVANACRKMIAAELPMLEPCRQAIKEGKKPTIGEIDTWRRLMVQARKA